MSNAPITAPLFSDKPESVISTNVWLRHFNTPINSLSPTLPEFTGNASAIAGGVPKGGLYRTATGVLMIVY
jgi:hypothetical protein